MTTHAGADVGCLVVGGYVDGAELPEPLARLRDAPTPGAQVERPRVVAGYLDLWAGEPVEKMKSVD
jgi:hypothetical protein